MPINVMKIQLRDYLEWIVTPITEDDIAAVTMGQPDVRPYPRNGLMMAVLTSLAVLSLGAVFLLIGTSEDLSPSDTIPRNGGFIADSVLSGSDGDAHFSVGISDIDDICATVRIATMLQTTCGGNGLEASVFRAGAQIIVAGYAPEEMPRLTLIFEDGNRVPLVLTPIPGRGMNAFGAIEISETRFVEIEGLDEQGELLIRFFPSIGTTENFAK